MKRLLVIIISIVGLAACNNDGDKTASTTDSSSITQSSKNNETSTAGTTSGRVKRTVQPSEKVQSIFVSKYPKATNPAWEKYDVAPDYVDWEITGWPAWDTSWYLVTFDNNGYNNYAIYDPKGDWMYSITEIKSTEVPAAVNATLVKEFPDYQVKSVSRENDKDREAYEIKMENGEDKMKALIDVKGNILKKKGKENGEKIKEKNI